MRNYVAIKGIKFSFTVPFFGFTADLYAFGADEDELMAIVRQYQTFEINNWAPHEVTFAFPNVVQELYILLDKLTVSFMANRDAAGFWQDSALGRADGSYPSGVLFPLHEYQTQINESPRDTWPTPLGTDGQRLKK